MDKAEQLRKIKALQMMNLGNTSIGVPAVAPTLLNRPEEIQQIQPSLDMPLEQRVQTGEHMRSEEDPMTKIDTEALRREVLERLKNRGTQKLNFKGNFLESQGIQDNE